MRSRQGGRSCAKHEGPSSKSLDSDENFKLQHMLYCRNIMFCCDLCTFWKTLGKKKCSFRSKTVFFGQKVPYYMVNIAYYTEFNLQICNYAQKRRICRGNSKDVPDKNFCGHFCPRRKAANFCHPVLSMIFFN